MSESVHTQHNKCHGSTVLLSFYKARQWLGWYGWPNHHHRYFGPPHPDTQSNDCRTIRRTTVTLMRWRRRTRSQSISNFWNSGADSDSWCVCVHCSLWHCTWCHHLIVTDTAGRAAARNPEIMADAIIMPRLITYPSSAGPATCHQVKAIGARTYCNRMKRTMATVSIVSRV
jgi:hypothetical protein